MHRLKLVSLVVAVAFLATSAHAQWIGTAPGPIYYDGGKVGIGSSNTPQYELDVTGSIGVLGTNAFVRPSSLSDGLQLTFLGTRLRLGQLNSRAYGYTGSALAFIGGHSDGVELLRINSNTGNGNLVVTQSGVDSLQLNAANTNIRRVHTDTASGANTIDFAEGTTAYGFLTQTGSTHADGGKFNIGNNVGPLGVYSAGQERMRILTNGNVGLGVPNPLSKLDVGGDMRASGVSTIMAEVSSLNPAITLRVGGANGYYPALQFQSEAYQSIGSLYGWKGGGLILQSGPNHALLFRAHDPNVNAMVITTAGNVGIGTTPTAYKFEVAGNAHFSGSVTGGNIAAKYQDVAEWVPSAADMSAGTVVVLDPKVSNQVMASARPYDTTVAGVVSEQPGLILGEAAASKEMIATTGRVKVRVDATRAPIRIGDLLVTSSKPGAAMKSDAVEVAGVQMHRPGTIIGKALEALDGGEGEILVLLSMQ